LPAGGALGRGVGPLLLSHGSQWNPGSEVLVPGWHTTANFLLDFWYQKPLKKRLLQFDELYQYLRDTPASQGVVIHEKRFTYAQDGLNLIQDLGTHWETETGFPIPLGALLARNGLDAAAITAAIQESLEWAYDHHHEAFALCRKYSADLTPAVVQAHIDLYVNEFSYDLGDVGRQAVEFFFKQQEHELDRAGQNEPLISN
jgi:1,4-dihydroxy-6-naphthoate synthase